MRVIRDLKWVEPLASRPAYLPKVKRLRGAPQRGIQFENAVAKALPEFTHGQWFEFEDSKGKGCCQTDLFFVRSRDIVLLECKNTWLLDAHTQVGRLYKPILEACYQKPVLCIVVVKNLGPLSGIPVEPTLKAAVVRASLGPVVWQFLPWKGQKIRIGETERWDHR
jgi:hypothetical protein